MVLPEPRDLACAEVIRLQESGADPTADWRAACAADLARQYAIEPPTHVAAVFVLQWYLGALAQAGAHFAATSARLPALLPDHLSIERSGPGGYPVAVGLHEHTPLLDLPDAAARWERASVDYRAHAERFTASYRPAVKLGSALRTGSVTDAWDAARASAERSWMPPTWRASCCFIYALPGVHECARCPRQRGIRS